MTEQPQPTTLQSLLDQAATDRHLSGRKLAELAQQQGFALVSTTVNQIRSGAYKSQPSEDTLKAIAWLAGVSPDVAYRAAGITAPGLPFADDLPPGVDTLGPRERKVAIAMLSALVAQQGRIDELERDKTVSADEGPGLRLVDPAETKAARKGRTRASREREQADLWDGVDDPGPDEGV